MPEFWPVEDNYSGIANAITNKEKSFNDEPQFAKGDCYYGVRKIIESGGAHYYDLCFFPLAITLVKDDKLKNYSLSFACFFIDLSLMMNCAKTWS